MEQLETEEGNWWEDGRNVTALASWYATGVSLGLWPQHSAANAALMVCGIYENPDFYTDLWRQFVDARPVG